LLTTGGKIVTQQAQAVKIRHSVGAAEYADDFTLLHYGKTPDIMLDHQMISFCSLPEFIYTVLKHMVSS
jgi:hypothetical protein